MQRFGARALCLAAIVVSVHAYAAFPSPALQAPPAAAAGQGELLAVRINEVEQPGEVLAIRLSAHSLAVPLAALAGWRLRTPAAKPIAIDGQPHLPLDAIEGIRWRIDDATQTLEITVPSSAFLRNDFEVVSQLRPAQATARLGGYANYDLHWEHDAGASGGPGSQIVSGLLEAGAFSAQGNGHSTALFRQSGALRQLTRLDTVWNIDMPARLSSLRLGDAIGTAGAWGRSVRYGGVQWATDFAVQPGLVSFPMPAMKGEATVPSVVDLYVNSQHQLQGNVPPGPFDLPDVPVVSGAGQIRMVVRDLLGREQVIVQPYYVSPALLRAGLHNFSVEAGLVRQDYGIESNHYGRAMFTATDREGVSNDFTRELRVEMLQSQQTAGASGLWLVRDVATANLSAAASHGPGGAGWLAAAGLDRQSANWSAGLQVRATSRDFVQLGQDVNTSTVGAPSTVRQQVTANLATTLSGGGIGVNVLAQSTWQGDRFRSVSVNYGHGLGGLAYFSMFVSRTGGSSQGTSIGLNLIRSLGDTAAVSAGTYLSRNRSVTTPSAEQDSQQDVLQVQSAAPVGPGFGYQLQAERGNYARTSGDLTWQTEQLSMTAGVADASGGASYRGGVSGAFAVMPEGVFASRRIDGSFAVVQVGDYEGVRVLRDNQVVSRTDSQGRAFVPGLRGFESNRISVESSDLPLDAEVEDLHVAVAPGRGSGVSVRFPVTRTRAASLRLYTADGQAVPAGSWVKVAGAAREYPVGLDGRLFLAGLGDRSTIHAAWEGHACDAEVVLDPAADSVPELGVVTCR